MDSSTAPIQLGSSLVLAPHDFQPGWAPEALRLMKRKLGSNVDKGGWKSPAGCVSWMRSATSYDSNRMSTCRGSGVRDKLSHMDACYYAYRSKLGGNALVVATVWQ